MKKVYHYTHANRADSILESGLIKASTAFIEPREVPAVWLSTADMWEKTASTMDSTGKALTLAEAIARTGALARFEINPAAVTLIPPLKIRKLLRIRSEIYSSLVRVAKLQRADPSEWRAVKGDIPLSACVRLEFATSADPFNWSEASMRENA